MSTTAFDNVPTTEIKVELPFRGEFSYVHSYYEYREMSPSEGAAEALKQLQHSSRLTGDVLNYDEAYRILSNVTRKSPYGLVNLTQYEIREVLNLLALPDTLGVEGLIPWVDARHTEFVVHEPSTKVFHWPASWLKGQVIARVYQATKASVFRLTVNGVSQIVENADQVGDPTVEPTHVTLEVRLPFRALFSVSNQSWEALHKDARLEGWSAGDRTALFNSLLATGVFQWEVPVPDYGAAYWAISQVELPTLGRLRDEERAAVLDALIIPGTRCLEGNYTYVNPNDVASGYIFDTVPIERLRVEYKRDGRYEDVLRKKYRLDMLRYRIVTD